MKIIAEVPGSCGELLQGTVAGQPLLVTCPIDQYSRAVLEEGAPLELPPKAEKMARLASAFYGVALDSVRITLHSELPRSKGMSSSSADMAAVAKMCASSGAYICFSKVHPDLSAHPLQTYGGLNFTEHNCSSKSGQ